MSQTLSSNILSTGNLKELIYNALQSFGTEDFTGPREVGQIQRQFADKLAEAIAEGVAKGVQQYLTTQVTAAVGGVPPHVHTIIAP